MPSLYINTTESSYGGEPESNEEWCHHSDVVRSVTFNGVYRNKSDSFWSAGQSFEVSEEVFKSERVFLVIVRYRDGGTFGSTTGNWHIQQAFTNPKEAKNLAASILDGSYEKKMDKKHGQYGHYMPWVGYFSSLESVEIHSFKIKDNFDAESGIIFHD